MTHRLRFTGYIFITMMLCAAALWCHDIDLVLDRSAYEPHRSPTLTGWGENVPDRLQEGERFQYQGIYAVEPRGRIGLVRRFDRRQGWSHAILSEALPVQEGALIAVSGRVVMVEQPITGTGRVHRSRRLKPDDIEVLFDTAPAREQARRIYARIRPQLQDRIALPGSRLVLAEEPRWRVDWLAGEATFVVVAHSFDLMYAAETQFLFSLEDEQLQRIYFMEWFKGE